MIHMVLMVLVLVIGASGRIFPRDELDGYMKEVLFKAEGDLTSSRPLADHDYNLDYFFWGSSKRFKVKTSNAVIHGPRRLKNIGVTKGLGDDSGTVTVLGVLDLGTIEVEYSNIEANILGLSYNGSGGMSITDATVQFSIHVYRDALVKCYVAVTLSQLEGEFAMTLGKSYLNKLMYTLASRIISKAVYPYNLLKYFLFPDITKYLERVIQRAAKKVSC